MRGFRGSASGADNSGRAKARTDANGTAFYHHDAGGNITAMTDGNGNVVARYLYDPFGNLLAKSGVMADVNRYRFSSKEVHPNSGLYYYGYRFYEPNLQRWLNEDPIGEAGGFNLYGFVGNSAANAVDPLGLKSFHEHMEEIGQGIYDWMMNGDSGERHWERNTDAKGALDSDALGGIDPNNNVLRDSIGEGTAMLGEGAKFAGEQYALGKAGEMALGLAGKALCRLKPLLGALKKGEEVAKEAVASEKGAKKLADASKKCENATAKEPTLAVGRVKDLQKLGPEETSLLNRTKPDLGNPKANWKRNWSLLRQEMQRGLPIRDASIGDTRGQFLNAERYMLRARGWTFDAKTGYWMPPAK